MNALFSVLFFDAGSRVGGAGHVDSEHCLATSTQKTAKLCGTRVVRYWFDNARPFGETQSYAGVAR